MRRIQADGRDPKYIGERYLGRMIESGELEYTIPEVESHMNQAYRTPASNETRGPANDGP